LSQLHLLPRFIPKRIPIKETVRGIFRRFCTLLRRTISFIPVILLLGSCERKDNNLLDSVATPPILGQVTLLPSRINSDSMNVGSSRQPDDLLTIATTVVAQVEATSHRPISVRYSITSFDSLDVVSKGVLLDDGQGSDHAKGDGLYSGKPTFQIRRVQIGTYAVSVHAESDDGYRSNAAITRLSVFRGNRPPFISDLVAPDTVTLSNQSQLLLLKARVDDPDGLNDIARVVFNSYKPDGSASGGNPFQMYDDGLPAHGDERAADGIFSLLISLPSNAQLGTYKFEFQSFDRSNEPSNIIILRLTVKP
jgi:hypothetical protein